MRLPVQDGLARVTACTPSTGSPAPWRAWANTAEPRAQRLPADARALVESRRAAYTAAAC